MLKKSALLVVALLISATASALFFIPALPLFAIGTTTTASSAAIASAAIAAASASSAAAVAGGTAATATAATVAATSALGMSSATGFITTIGALALFATVQNFDSGGLLHVQLDPASQPDPALLPPYWSYDASGNLVPPPVIEPIQLADGSYVIVFTQIQGLPFAESDGSKRISPAFNTHTEAGLWLADFITCYFSGTTYCMLGERQVNAATGSGVIFDEHWESISAHVAAYVNAGRPFTDVSNYTERRYRLVSLDSEGRYIMDYDFVVRENGIYPVFQYRNRATITSHVPRVIDFSQYNCPAGYELSGSSCVLADPAAIDPAAESMRWPRDGQCLISRGPAGFAINPFDPDCDGIPPHAVQPGRVILVNDGGVSTVIDVVEGADGGVDISRVVPRPDKGITEVEKVPVRPDAQGKPRVQSIDKSANPGTGPAADPHAPYFPTTDPRYRDPGTPTAPALPAAPAPAGPTCGTPGQPRCEVAVAGAQSEKDDELFSDLPSLGPADDTDSVLAFIRSLAAFELQKPDLTCAVALDTSSNTAEILGQEMTLNLAEICPLIEPNFQEIQRLMLVLWGVFAALIFVRFTI